jgi:dihydroorotate dehydrogenase (NAD+) catalytic subunit
MPDLSIQFCGVHFPNPFVLPSGITSAYDLVLKSGAAAITWKTITLLERKGNPPPNVWKFDCGVINSVGLRNPGIDKGCIEVEEFMRSHPNDIMIASVFATKVSEFVTLVEKMAAVKPHFIELNLSCPNVDDEFGKPLGMETGAAGKIVAEAKRVSQKIPVLAKLSPNVSNISEIAKSCEASGADGIVAINTVGPGMIIDIKKRKPAIGAKKGGVSGAGILPVTVRCIYEIYEAVKIPIIGMGGVTKWQDVVEVMMAGATLVGVGTATYTRGMKVYGELKTEMQTYMESEGIKNLKELVGVAHT